MLRLLSKMLLWVTGWKVAGEFPSSNHVVVVAPHTSNWDFIIGRSMAYSLRLNAKFLAKSQLFFFPVSFIFKFLGEIPVDRTKNNDLVSFAIDLLVKRKNMVLGIAPEGSRSRVEQWKLGFYHIAQGANVPIALSFLDFEKKEAGVGLVIFPGGDIQKDMKSIEDFYKDVSPKIPANYNPKIF